MNASDIPKPITYWYRLEDELVSDGYNILVKVHVRKLIVIKHTPKGVKLIGGKHGFKNPRFVAHNSKKQYACSSIEKARESFEYRKARQIKIYKAPP